MPVRLAFAGVRSYPHVMRQRLASAALLPVDEAVQRLTADLSPVAPRRVDLRQAEGLVLADDVHAPDDAPRVATALRNGWAIAASSVTGASPSSPVFLQAEPPWVDSGEALPPETDAVLAREAYEDGALVGDAPRLEGVRSPGEEMRAGDRLASRGDALTVQQMLALGAAAIRQVDVRTPRLRIVATGARSRGVAEAVGAIVSQAGAEISGLVESPSDPDAIAATLTEAEGDAVLVVGGTGDGRADRSVDALARCGSVYAHGVALRPGESTAFGDASGRRVLLLPGRPDAALAAFVVLGLSLLDALSGRGRRVAERIRLVGKATSTIGLSEAIFLRRSPSGAHPLGGADTPLARLAQADGLMLVPPGREGCAAGEEVEMMSW